MNYINISIFQMNGFMIQTTQTHSQKQLCLFLIKLEENLNLLFKIQFMQAIGGLQKPPTESSLETEDYLIEDIRQGLNFSFPPPFFINIYKQ